MARIVNVHEAKTTLSRLLDSVAAGERVVIAKAGRPVADLVPHTRTEVVFGAARHLIEFDSDAFDDPDPEVDEMFHQL